MKAKSNFFLYGFLFLALSTILAGVLWLEKPRGYALGRILTESGEPLAKAKVIFSAYPKDFSAFTDKDGNFKLYDIPVGKYYARVQRKGYQAFYSSGQQEILESKGVDLGAIRLKELEPNFYAELWGETKLPNEKITLSINGAKVKELHLSLYRIDLSAYLASEKNLSDLREQDLSPEQLPKATLVKDWFDKIPDEEVAEFDRKLPVAIDANGVYLIRIVTSSVDRQKVFSKNVLVNRTALGFLVKRDRQRLLIYASNLLEGKALTQASLEIFSPSGQKFESKTDARGIVEINLSDLSLGRGSSAILLQSGDSVAFSNVPWDYSASSDEGEAEGEDGESVSQDSGTKMGLLYTERPLYRPGQSVYFKGILRNRNDQGQYQLLPNETLQIEVLNSKSDSIYETSISSNAYGSFWGEFNLSEEAELGYYSINATTSRGKEFRQDFEVDAYRKPEFKVEIFPDRDHYFSQEKINFNIDTQFYFGAPLSAQIEYSLYKSPYYPASVAGDSEEFYGYEDEGIGGYGELLQEGKTKTDENGKLLLSFEAPKELRSQRLTLRVTATDLTGRQVMQENDALVYPGDFYFETQKTEFLAFPEKPYRLKVLSYNYQGQPLATSYEIRIEKQKWNPIASQNDYHKIKSVEGATNAQGLGESELSFEKSGYYRLVIAGKDQQGRKVESYDYLWVGGRADDQEDFGLSKSLLLIPQKKKLKPEETAKLLLVSPIKNAEVLVTIEGDKIQDYRLEKIDGFSKTLEIPLKREWLPNVFVTVSAIGKKEFYEASVELSISPAEHYLNVEINSDKTKYQPGDEIAYRIKTKDERGKAVSAELSLGVVDESIYALKADATNIKEFFWGNRPNRVSSNYSFSGYYSGGIEKEDQKMLRRNFKDTAYWNPSIVTNEQGKGEVRFKLPDNLTTWRATVIAQSTATDVGQQIQKVISTKDLVLRLGVPRFFRERDQLTMKALVQNYSEQEQLLNVSFNFEGLDFVHPEQAKDRSLKIAPKQTQAFDIEVKVSKPGEAKLQFLAKNDKLSDGFELKIPVLPYGIEEHQYLQGSVAAGETAHLALNLPPKTDLSKSKLQLTLDASWVAQLLGPLSYLVEYPYGCVEQTSSRLLAAMTIGDLDKNFGLGDEALRKKIGKVIDKGLKRLAMLQNSEGVWGWWKNDKADLWMSAYANYALIKAAEYGEVVPESLKEKAREGLAQLLKSDDPSYNSGYLSQEETKYFLHYVASLAGLPARLPMAKVALQSKLSKAFAALTLAAQNHQDLALPIVQGLEAEAICNDGLCYFSNGQKYQWGDAELTAWVLKAMLKADSPDIALRDSVVQWLLQNRKQGYWRQTRETAAVLDALSFYAKSQPGAQAGVKADIALEAQRLEGVNVASAHFVRNLKNIALKEGKNSLSLSNLGENPLYYQADLVYFLKQDEIAPLAQGIKVKREYLRLKGKIDALSGEKTFEAKTLEGKIQKGETLGVRLTIENENNLSYVMLEDLLPSGFEVSPGVSFDKEALVYAEQEVHDEKIALFMSYLPQGKHVLNYGLRPELIGQFNVMPAQAYPMYQPEIRGSSASTRLEVQ